MANEAQGLHRLAFEPQIRFLRQQDDGGCWAECVVCGDTVFGSDVAARELAIAKHRELIHVVMVYPYGMPKPPARLRRARTDQPAAGGGGG